MRKFIEIPDSSEIESSLSSITIKEDASGKTHPIVKIYSKSNNKKDILAAAKWSIEIYKDLKKRLKSNVGVELWKH